MSTIPLFGESSSAPERLLSVAAVTLFERMPTGALISDGDGRILHANPAAAGLLGYTRDELADLALADLLQPEIEHTLAAQGDDPAPRPAVRVRCKDGSVLHIVADTVAVAGDAGLLLTLLNERVSSAGAIAGGAPHISEQAQQSLIQAPPPAGPQQATALPRVIAAALAAETVSDAAAIAVEACTELLRATAVIVVRAASQSDLEVLAGTGIEGNLLRPSTRFSRSADLPIAEAVRTGRPVRIANTRQRSARFPLLSGLNTIGETGTIAVPMLVHDRVAGAISLFLPTALPYTDDDEALLLAVAGACGEAIMRAEAHAAEQALRQEGDAALRQREALLASISHDLRTPLTAIKGEAQLLQRRAARLSSEEGDLLADGLEHIDAVISRMSLLLTDLTDLARSNAPEPALNRQPTDLIEIVLAGVAEARLTSEARLIELDCTVEQLTGNWDAAGLARVVSNLLSNAIKYSPNGSTITVAVARAADASGETAVLTVRDRGVGIPENELGRIFDPYHRGANVAGRTAGTGIGLVSARQIVEQHGGGITAESTLGRGSTFTVRLPLR